MKRLIIILVVFISFLSQNNSYTQWSTDPNNPMAVCNEILNQTAPTVTTDGSGGYFVFWADRRSYGSTTIADLYGQRLDANGNKLWALPGKKIVDSIPYYITPKAVYTGKGNDIILYSTTNGGNKIWARKIDLNGNNVWANPSAIFVQTTAHINASDYVGVTDNSGGVVVSYQLTYNGGATFIFAQRADANGNLKWNPSGNGLNLSVTGQSRVPVMTIDGRGGANIFWFNVPGPYYIWKTHIDTSGNFLPKDTLKLTGNNYPQIRATYDGSGGAVVTWASYPGSASSNIYAQRVDIGGNELWDSTGVEICTDPDKQDDPNIERTSDGNYIIVWSDGRTTATRNDVYSQKVDPNGNPLWTSNGLLITDYQTLYPKPNLIKDNSGGAYIFVLNNVTDFSVMRIDGNGMPVWNPPFRTLASQTYKPFYEVFELQSHAEGAIVVWQTFNNIGTNGVGIYGAEINSSGTLNIRKFTTEIPDGFFLYQNYPNPFNPVTKIKFALPQDARGETRDVMLRVYDALGKEVVTLVDEKLSAGSYEAEFNGNKFSSGIYFYKLEAGDFSEVKSMVLLR